MPVFYRLLAIALFAVTANNFVWFGLTYWAYLSTGSVVATSTMAGIFLVVNGVSGIWLGSVVDHHKKRNAMIGSSLVSLLLFGCGLLLYLASPPEAFASVASPRLWLLITTLLCGTVAGSVYMIAMPTLVAIVVPEEMRAKANGMFGTAMGIAFGITSFFSGLALAGGGMRLVLSLTLGAIVLILIALALVRVNEPDVAHDDSEAHKGKLDLKGTWAVVRSVPGLLGLIFFTTINNLLGGVFFALMDAYGLSLVSVEVWGMLWGVLSLSMIAGGLVVSRRGVGRNPVWTMFRINLITWATCLIFPLQPSIVLLIAGTATWMFCMPFIEASEQTIFQKVVPSERLGRAFGFAHAVEQSASPLTAFMIGPITQAFFIPLMTDGAGARLIGSWFGTGTGRGIAVVFILSGMFGLCVTYFAMRTKATALLAAKNENSKPNVAGLDGAAPSATLGDGGA